MAKINFTAIPVDQMRKLKSGDKIYIEKNQDKPETNLTVKKISIAKPCYIRKGEITQGNSFCKVTGKLSDIPQKQVTFNFDILEGQVQGVNIEPRDKKIDIEA
ncbi:MAG: hypothetical protein ACD_20C00046G0004 [uncultured bacterium]|nr:MAG: hypothetical protein ACD_20C00046G0004 [uncultured bacterium]